MVKLACVYLLGLIRSSKDVRQASTDESRSLWGSQASTVEEKQRGACGELMKPLLNES